MKCKDCLREIDEKEYNNKSVYGVCKKCRHKRNQIKYLNKKNGTNLEYVPKKTIGDKESEKQLKDNKKIYENSIEKEVASDIQKTFQKYGIFIKQDDAIPLQIFMQMFIELLDIKNGYMTNYMKAEDVFNKMENDYQHMFEDAQEPELMIERAKKFRCLLDKRRNVKNINVQYSKIARLIAEIVEKVPDVLNQAKIAKENLDKIINLQQNHSYKAQISELVQEEEFCIGKKISNAVGDYKYNVSVKIYNYNGNKGASTFDRVVWAKDKEDAIKQVKAFLANRLPHCTYKENDFIAIELYQDSDLSEEVCS